MYLYKFFIDKLKAIYMARLLLKIIASKFCCLCYSKLVCDLHNLTLTLTTRCGRVLKHFLKLLRHTVFVLCKTVVELS